jgi:hypothetical protein
VPFCGQENTVEQVLRMGCSRSKTDLFGQKTNILWCRRDNFWRLAVKD